VKQTGADLGVAFDGDGDRLGVVTRSGEIVFPDRTLMLFARDVLSRQPGATIIYDVKCTGHLKGEILDAGGSPLMWRTGHSLIKAKMRETGAELAGEMSGHFFFKERWYGFDDGIYAGARLLEIGGGYGFGLDFAIRARHWRGEGYDPSPLAAYGARTLGLALKQAYFGEHDLGGERYDVAIATEVIEHLAEAEDFLKLMFRALGEGGVLLLTTPDGERISPGLGAAGLLPILSPGAHLVLHSMASLEFALRKAGFAHVEIHRSGLSLIAYASAKPFALRDEPAQRRRLYRDYLLTRSRTASQDPDLLLGLAGRAIFEAVNDGDFGAAEAAWELLLPAVRERFGLDLDHISELPAGVANADLAELARRMPLNLGMILYARAMRSLARQVQRRELSHLFRMAIAALDALQGALARRSLTDALGWALRAAAKRELTLCLAETGDPECLSEVMAELRHDPSQRVLAWRVFVALVNGAHFEAALGLQQRAGLYAPDEDDPVDLRRDALFTTGMLALQNAADWPRAAAIFAQLRRLLERLAPQKPENAPLFWPTVRGEILALKKLGREEEALALLQQVMPHRSGAPEDLRRLLP
jgi:SAM-dependent methyltransferase